MDATARFWATRGNPMASNRSSDMLPLVSVDLVDRDPDLLGSPMPLITKAVQLPGCRSYLRVRNCNSVRRLHVPSATLTSKGQLTLPKVIRERLRVRAGDHVELNWQDDGTFIVRAATVDVRELKGLLHR